LNFAAHDTYTQDVNLVDQGADYAANRLARSRLANTVSVALAPDQWAAPTPPAP
jgi:hypothetical protein